MILFDLIVCGIYDIVIGSFGIVSGISYTYFASLYTFMILNIIFSCYKLILTWGLQIISRPVC